MAAFREYTGDGVTYRDGVYQGNYVIAIADNTNPEGVASGHWLYNFRILETHGNN